MCVYLCKMHIPCLLMYICDAFPYIACTKEYTNHLFSQCVFFSINCCSLYCFCHVFTKLCAPPSDCSPANVIA